MRRVHPKESRGLRALGAGVVTTADAAKILTTQAELATVADYLGTWPTCLLSHAAERFQAIVNDAAPLLTVSDLKRLMGKRESEAITSVEDLERLFRL